MKILTEEQILLFKTFIQEHDFFLITGHKDPDGDVISSCLGIAAIMEKSGKPYQLLSAGPFKRQEIRNKEPLFSQTMRFLSQDERNKTGLIIADCSEFSRLGEIEGDLKGLDTFIIDHHKTSGQPDGCKSIIDPSSPATSCIIQMLYEGIIGKLDKAVAKELFFGMSTDTGFFRFLTEDSAEVFRASARLVEAGANPRSTYEEITGGKPYLTRKLLGKLLEQTEVFCGGKLIVTYETMEDTRKYGSEGRDSDMLYQLLLSTEGVEAVVFVRQETDNTCTAGFRSKDKIDVSAVAASFGGGGHKNASGMSVEGKLNTLIPEICKKFARIL
ncbi:bifunctional oligoribonuclease/PAP phosphatase NrnA [Treponema parvum]|uniref:Bifunctional oligoribonuclease/PAP phosphatase NrnA n=1 Tax=Treponema parvum TaxID=138851 RepID=A0A975IFB8_9SPIR|nr:bifunctional oligoribonuclease/PAP phosphatase NrnA [Treponema parvum]QTQ14174.1 bifunctional oligoribonuclease/PAP phosphatase NrnA [Treponema parvum]